MFSTRLKGWGWVGGLAWLCAAVFFYRLGRPGLMDPDEGRYAEIAREMLASGDFLTPTLNFLPYLEKPPLVYWLTAASFHLFGLQEWAARLVPAVSAWGGVLAVFWLGRRLGNVQTGFWAALITATSAGYVILGRILTLDMTLTCFLTWGLALAYQAWRTGQGRYLFLAYGAWGLGVLVKGPVALVLPGLIFLTWLLLERAWRHWPRFWHPGGAVLLALLVLPWYLLVAWHNPEFWRYFFWEEHVQRFLTPRIHAGQPVYFYVGVVVVGLLPWTFLLPWALSRPPAMAPEGPTAADRRFLLTWFAVVFVFFSLARAKLFPYLLPGLPPLALLLGQALAGSGAVEVPNPRVWRAVLVMWLLVAAGLLAFSALLPWLHPSLGARAALLMPYLRAGGVLLVLLPFILLVGPPRLGWIRPILASGALALALLIMLGVERLAVERSPRDLARLIIAQRQADTVIVGYQMYSQALSFYTGQPLYLYGIRGELAFGLGQRPGNPYYLGTSSALTTFLQQHSDVMMIISEEQLQDRQGIFPQPVKVLGRWRQYLLIRNH